MGKQQLEKIAPSLQYVVFRLGKEEFGVNIKKVREIVRMPVVTRIPDAPRHIDGVANLRGEIIAVVDLAKHLNMSAQSSDEHLDSQKKLRRLIIIDFGSLSTGFVVDEVPEIVRLTQAQIEEAPEFTKGKIRSEYLEGIARIDERLLVLVDLEKALSDQEIKSTSNFKQEDVA